MGDLFRRRRDRMPPDRGPAELRRLRRLLRLVALRLPRGSAPGYSTHFHPPFPSRRKHPTCMCWSSIRWYALFGSQKPACGVEFRPNPDFQPEFPATRVVRARKMVLISAGVLGSRPILERSGVSDAVYLKRGVEVVVDLPGVGHDYQVHNLTMVPYQISLSPEEIANAFYTWEADIDGAVE